MKTALIFSGGYTTGCEYVPSHYDWVVSADGGYTNALKFNVLPDLCLGDFDTLRVPIDPRCKTITFPAEKDDTDTMLCVKNAISMGCDTVYLYGATGGRFDHTLANLQSLEFLLNHNVIAYAIDAQNAITIQGVSTRVYHRLEGFNYFSVLALTDSVSVSAMGLKYPLQHTTLTRDFPLGVSNVLLSDSSTLTVHDGKAYVVYSKDA